MPIYEYRCDEGHVFETFQSITDEALTACTECGAPAERVLNAPAIHFKGSGFYTTDYGKSRSRAASTSDSDSGDSGASSSAETSSSGDSATASSTDSTKSAV